MSIQQMLADLKEWGLSQKAIADQVGTTQPTIHRAANGAGITYETGKAIEALHAEKAATQQLAS